MFHPWLIALAAAATAAAFAAAVSAWKTSSLLRAGERERDRLLSLSWDLIGTIGRDGRLKALNPAWEKSLGLTPETLASRPLLDFIHDSDRVATEAELLKLFSADHSATFQNRFKCPDGTFKWLSWTARSSMDDARVDVVARDLGARQRNQPTIEETRNFLNSVVENIPNMVFVKDAKDLTFVMFNRAGEELIGMPRESFIGKSDYDFFPKEQADFFTAKDREVLASDKVLDIPDETIQTRTGPRRLHTKKIAVRNAQGEATHLLGISEDITDRKQADMVKDDLLSMASHELRTPLTSIVWGLDMLVREETGTLPERAKETAALALDGARMLVRMLNDYLTIAHIESGRAAFILRPVSLPHFLRETLRTAALMGEPRRVTFSLKNEAADALVSADADRLTQVVACLLSNAARFSPEGGVVEVAVARGNGKLVRVSVTDRGPGVAPEIQDRLFQKFVHLPGASQAKGTGLGLSIVKTIVEKLGGRVGFESDPKTGTTFFFELPELAAP